MPSKTPKPKKVSPALREKAIDYYVRNYDTRTLAEMLVELEIKSGIPLAVE